MIKYTTEVETGDVPFPDEEDIAKSGVLSTAFGSKTKRRNQLVQRLKRARKYSLPVKGGKKKGKKKRKNRLGGNLTSGRSATTLKSMSETVSKHASPTHPGTGTDQSVHGGGSSSPTHTTSGKKIERFDPHTAAKVEEGETYIDVLNRERRAGWMNLPELEGDRTYWTRPHLVEGLEKEVTRLNRRGQRYLGMSEDEGLQLKTLDRTHAHTMSDGKIMSFVAVQVEGDPPTAPGYEFVGKIEHLQNEDGSYTNILKTTPGFEENLPERFRDAGPNCDVCQRNIYRKDTFIVRNKETGEFIQAGRDDLAVYTGFDEADQLANYTSQYADFISQMERGYDPDAPARVINAAYDPVDVLAVASKVSREEGFVSVSNASFDQRSTKDWVLDYMRDPQGEFVKHLAPEDADYEKAEKVQQWLNSLEDEDLANDYMWNLKVAATNPHGADERHFGLLASAINAHDREMGLQVERARQADLDAQSDWIGEVKERRDFTGLTISRHNTFEGQYGTTHVYEFIDEDNNNLVWFASNPISREVPDVERASEEAKFIEEGRKIFEERIVPAGGSIEGMVAVMGHTTGTKDRELKLKWLEEGRITPEIEARAREIWFGGSSMPPSDIQGKDLPEVVYQANSGEKNRVISYVRSVVHEDENDPTVPTKMEFPDVGDTIDLKATIKEHKLDTYGGRERKQTIITRGKLIE